MIRPHVLLLNIFSKTFIYWESRDNFERWVNCLVGNNNIKLVLSTTAPGCSRLPQGMWNTVGNCREYWETTATGCVPDYFWQYSILYSPLYSGLTLAVFHTISGCIPESFWQYSILLLAVSKTTSGSVPDYFWQYSKPSLATFQATTTLATFQTIAWLYKILMRAGSRSW